MFLTLESGAIEFLVILGWMIFGLFGALTSKLDYWIKLKIPGPDPNVFCGNVVPVVLRKMSFVERINELCEKWKSEPYFGIFVWWTPVLIVTDLNVINNILVENTELFSLSNIGEIENSNHVDLLKFPKNFILEELTENVEEMFALMLKCTESYDFNIHWGIQNHRIIDCCEFTKNLISDIVASCLFGIDSWEYSGEKCQFRKIVRETLLRDDSNLGEKFFNVFTRQRILEQRKFFTDFIDERIKSRDESNATRPDFIDILRASRSNENNDFVKIAEQNYPITEVSDGEKRGRKDGSLLPRCKKLVSATQAFYLVNSGWNTSSSLISSALSELAVNQNIQEKLRSEILETMTIHENKLSYDVVNEMEYISMILSETLRKYPSVPLLSRKLNEKHRIEEDSPLYIQKNTRIIIPVSSIHYNEEYYPEPHTFKPERFSKVEIEKRHSMAYLPYGRGLHHCIGEKFSSCSAKLALITVLKRFRVEPVNEQLKTSGNSGKINLKFSPLK